MDNSRAVSSRRVLLNRIQICDFALNDVALFLDTHPDNQMALAFYKKHLEMRKQAHDEYVEKYGPITRMDYDGGARWNWVDSPWPWENSSEV